MAEPKKDKLPIDILIKHLKEFKDAVIILGPDILEDIKQFEVTEETYEFYNRKKMIKEPKEFWKYYSDNIMKPLGAMNESIKQLNLFLGLKLHSAIIDTNMIKTIAKEYNAISPNGKNSVLECVKCHKEYDATKMFEQLQNQEKTLKCECGGNIKPTVLYHGERYNTHLYNTVKNSIFKENGDKVDIVPHTLIFIGCDFTDSLVSEIIDSYDALKDGYHLTVVITDKLNRDDLIYYNPEFGVADDLNLALERLIKLLK